MSIISAITVEDTAIRLLIAVLGGHMIGWALGYFI
jgi:hypothetical protein